MSSKNNPFEDKRRPWIVINGPVLPPLPNTTSLLAFSILGGVLFFTPMVALIGDRVPTDYREAVVENLKLMRDALLLVLGYYFSKVVNSGEASMAYKALQVAQQSQPPVVIPASAQEAATAVADAAKEEADQYQPGDTKR